MLSEVTSHNPSEVIDRTCMIQTSANNPVSQEKKWINAVVQKMTWALARALWHNNRDIELAMLITRLCLASRASQVFYKLGLYWRLASCKHSFRYGRLKKSLLMLQVPLGAPWLTVILLRVHALIHWWIINENIRQITLVFLFAHHNTVLHVCLPIWYTP